MRSNTSRKHSHPRDCHRNPTRFEVISQGLACHRQRYFRHLVAIETARDIICDHANASPEWLSTVGFDFYVPRVAKERHVAKRRETESFIKSH
jgi:hypothetical protein